MKNVIYSKLMKLAVVFLVVLMAVSCVNLKKVELMQQKTVTDYSQEIVNARQNEYLINSGDHLYVKVYSSDINTSKMFQTDFPELMTSSFIYLNSYKVDEEGYVNYSFAGKVMVKGLTMTQAQEAIKAMLSEYYKDINVYVKLVNFEVTVLGEVKSPGTFQVDREQLNVFQALGMAEGVTDFGRAEQVTLIRKSPNGSIVKQLDLTDNGLLTSEYYYLLPDDVIYVAPRKSKPFIFETFPYAMIFSVATLALAIYAITED